MNRRSTVLKALFVVSAGAVLASGCVEREVRYRNPPPAYAPDGEVVVTEAPPAPIEETVTVAPGPDFVWLPGAYIWVGGRWSWRTGRWDHPPYRGAHWVGPHYEYRGGRHVYYRGGWRR